MPQHNKQSSLQHLHVLVMYWGVFSLPSSFQKQATVTREQEWGDKRIGVTWNRATNATAVHSLDKRDGAASSIYLASNFHCSI